MSDILISCGIDLNRTLCAGDSTKSSQGYDDSVTLNLCATLAMFLFGDDIDNVFVPSKEGKLSYKQFMTERLKLEKKEREAKTRQIIQDFPFLRETYEKMVKVVGSDFLLPSAKKLLLHLKRLHEESRPVVACIRTFGTDCKLLKKSLNELGIELVVVHVDKIQKVKDFIQFIQDEASCTTFRAYFIQDNYTRWKEGGFTSMTGKVFPLVENAYNIFLDDNADENIVDPRTPEGVHVPPHSLSKSQGTIVQVNPYENIVNEDYFLQWF